MKQFWKESEPHAGKMSKNRRQTGAAYAAWALGWDALVQLTTLRNPDRDAPTRSHWQHSFATTGDKHGFDIEGGSC